MSTHRVADATGVRVMAEQCATCIFRPGNLMHLRPGRLRDLLAEAEAADSCIVCHETLEDELQAVCRGQYDALQTQPLQVAERLGWLVWWRRA